MKKIIIASITLFALILGLLQALTPARADVGVQRLRISVTQDSITRITPADLQNAGVDTTAIDPRTFAMSSQGQDVAIRVVGESDGSFDAGDYIEFFGQKYHGSLQDEKYTDENVYWLTIGDAPGLRIQDIDVTPHFNLTPPVDFAAIVHAEKNNYWYTQHRIDPPTKESWYWEQLKPYTSSPVASHTFTANVPYPMPDLAYTLIVEENARVSVAHSTTISFNGHALPAEAWEGKNRELITRTLPANSAIHGVNSVTIDAHLQPNVSSDWVFVNYWELHYRRKFSAWQGQIDFRSEQAGPHEYVIDGWETPQATLLDISNPLRPIHLVNPGSIYGQSWALRFRVNDAKGDHFWLQSQSSAASPAAITLRPPQTELRNPTSGADVIIVTGAPLQAAAQRLAAWHQQRGYSSRVVLFDDLVDEFNDGIYHPRAITNFMSWTQSHWPAPQPHYLVLFGDGHWNFKGYNTAKYPMDPIIIPPYLAWVDPWQGEVPADNSYADLDGDGNPEIALGRIPVNTPAEANAVVDKLISYDENKRTQYWQRQAIFIADYDPEVGDFAGVSDGIIRGYMPDDLIIHRIYRNITISDTAEIRQTIADDINSGAWMIQYAGHGSPDTWMKGVGWSTEDAENLHNSGKYPFISTFNCLDGYFSYPGRSSMAEVMLLKANAGSIIAISPTGLGATIIQSEFRSTLMQSIFHDDVRVLGDALLQAKQNFYQIYGQQYLIDTMTLFGDPTLKLPAGLNWDKIYAPLYMNPNPAPLAPAHPLPPRKPRQTEPLTPPL